MTPYLLAIDNGSQSTKVTIFDVRGHPVASARRRLKPYDTSVPGHAVHPGDDIWGSIRYACHASTATLSVLSCWKSSRAVQLPRPRSWPETFCLAPKKNRSDRSKISPGRSTVQVFACSVCNFSVAATPESVA